MPPHVPAGYAKMQTRKREQRKADRFKQAEADAYREEAERLDRVCVIAQMELDAIHQTREAAAWRNVGEILKREQAKDAKGVAA